MDLKIPHIISQISWGSHHVALLENSGKIYTFGWEENGRLGYSYQNKANKNSKQSEIEIRSVTPQCNERGIEEKFIQISWGYNFTLAISETNFLYSWGKGDKGAHWDGLNQDKWTLSKIDWIAQGVIYVSAGSEHCGYIDSLSNLYTWGNQNFGKLGNGKVDDVSEFPTKIEGKFITVSWGEAHTLAIGDNYQVYSWGWNSEGQLGSKRPREEWAIPSPIFHLKGKTMVNISAGRLQSLAVTIDGFVYCWGNNDNKQLGLKIESMTIPVLHKNLLGHGISFINTKYYKSYFISAFKDTEGDVEYYKRFVKFYSN